MKRSERKDKLKEILTRGRNQQGLSQQEVADAVGASLRNYQKWGGGETFPQPHYLQKLHTVFGVSMDEVTEFALSKQALQDLPTSNGQDDMIDISSEESENHTAIASQEDQFLQSSDVMQLHSGEDAAKTHQSLPNPPDSSQHKKHMHTILYITCICILVLVLTGVYVTFQKHVKPGGSWITPKNNETVRSIIHFAAYAYPTNAGEPAIDHINFTLWWDGSDPRTWLVACIAHPSLRKDIFRCDTNLSTFGTPAGKITVSFDVYDRQGNVNLAPNGERKLIYSP